MYASTCPVLLSFVMLARIPVATKRDEYWRRNEFIHHDPFGDEYTESLHLTLTSSGRPFRAGPFQRCRCVYTKSETIVPIVGTTFINPRGTAHSLLSTCTCRNADWCSPRYRLRLANCLMYAHYIHLVVASVTAQKWMTQVGIGIALSFQVSNIATVGHTYQQMFCSPMKRPSVEHLMQHATMSLSLAGPRSEVRLASFVQPPGLCYWLQ